MCGLAGVYNLRDVEQDQTALITSMCEDIRHRGPDHGGVYTDEIVSLGHRRLSILDLSAQANQPLKIDACVLVYNGEIYNFLELRKSLESEHGMAFSTTSDSEVIIRAYQTWGPDCVKRFNGMFAFLLWDKKARRLFAARDRLGVKPLLVGKNAQGYYFASDLKSLWHVFPASDLCADAVEDYFSYGFVSIPQTSTKGVQKFPPAHYLILENGKETWVEFWSLNDVGQLNVSFSDAVEASHTLLKNAIEIRLRSDVPVGAFLSGGIDSSLITAMASRHFGLRPQTFSIGFDSVAFDESRYAYRVASQYQTDHHHFRLDSGILNTLPQIVWAYSELFGDSSALPSYWVARYAADHLKVVLTGDGGDEAFGGYMTPYSYYFSRSLAHIPAAFRRSVEWLPETGFFRKLRRLNRLVDQDIDSAYTTALRSGGFLRWEGPRKALKDLLSQGGRKGVDQIFYADIRNQLTDDFLVKVDMATMAHSLEARSPFLDYRLMAYGYSLPARVKFHYGVRKAVLKEIALSYFDRSFVYRRKQGFSIPVSQWLASEAWHPKIEKIILRKTILSEYIPNNDIARIWGEFKKGYGHHNTRIWLLLWFQIWEGLVISRCYDPTQALKDL
ncbi:MAG: asparagine synthase (glutamine-hydrolyzing) [Candidatus Margulisiibacteriota bacterium]